MAGHKFILLFLVTALSACVPTTGPVVTPSHNFPVSTTPSHTITPEVTPSPTSCTGWDCKLTGIVCEDTGDTCSGVVDVAVILSQHSNCSPTTGEHETTTSPEGNFAFEIYIHDTDSFRITVEDDRYKPAEISFGGFDCLYCSCSPIAIILDRVETP